MNPRRVVVLGSVVALALITVITVMSLRDGARGSAAPAALDPADRTHDAEELAEPSARSPRTIGAEVEARPDRTSTTRGAEDRSVIVRVLSADGTPIAGKPFLECTDERGRDLIVRTDGAARVVRGVAPGSTLRVHAALDDHVWEVVEHVVPYDPDPSVVEIRLDRRPEPRRVLVRWRTAAGEPFAPEFARAWTPRSAPSLAIRVGSRTLAWIQPLEGRSLAEIRAQRPDAPADSVALVELDADADARLEFALGPRVLTQVVVAPHASEVVAQSDVARAMDGLGAVRGAVVSTRAKPNDKVIVSIEAGNTIYRRLDRRPSAGGFEFEGLEPGPAILRVRAWSTQHVRRIEIPLGGVLDVGDVEIAAGCPYTLRVTGPDGGPARSVRWCAVDPLESESANPIGDWILRAPVLARPEHAPQGDDAMLLVIARDCALTSMRMPPCGQRDEPIDVALLRGHEVVLRSRLDDPAPGFWIATAAGGRLGWHSAGLTGVVALRLGTGDYVARVDTDDVGTPFRVDADVLVDVR